MNFRRLILALLILCPAGARAVPPGWEVPAAPAAATSAFARQALRICVDTGADPALVRKLATTERWIPVDPATVESHDRVSTSKGKVERSSAWRLDAGGVPLTVSIYDWPGGLLFSARCEIGARGLDLKAAHAIFVADPRLKDRSETGSDFPIKRYEALKPPLTIVYAAGEVPGGILHTFIADRR